MKKEITIIFIIVLFFQSSLFSQFTNPAGYTGRLSASTKHINEGAHNSGLKLPKAIKYTTSNRRYDFDITFRNNSWYSSGGCGWNKVGRITFIRNTNLNVNKMHLGWQAILNDQNKIALSLFFHDGPETELMKGIDDNWIAHKLDTISTETKTAIDMFLGHDIIALIVNNNSLGLRKKGWIPDTKRSFLAKTYYFGGSCGAPQYMEAYFEDQKYDWTDYNVKFNSQESLTWNMSEFETGDVFEYYASKRILGSIADASEIEYNSNNPEPDRQKCIIHEGASISFISGESIYLYPGFHAIHGSEFLAKTQSPPQIRSLTFPNLISNSLSFSVENVELIEFDLYSSISLSDGSIYSGQVIPINNKGVSFIDTTLIEKQYYLVATLYSGKGSKSKLEGWIKNTPINHKDFDTYNHGKSMTNRDLHSSIYPNPSSDYLKLCITSSGRFDIQMYSIDGYIVYDKSERIEEEIIFDVSGYSSGIYYLILKTNDFQDIHRVIIK
jgi:hypothetical protein